MDTPTLTTMVVLYKMGVRLDTDRLVRELPLTEQIIKLEKQGVLKRGESSRDKIRHRPKPDAGPRRTTGFGHNSITLVVLSDGDGTLRRKEITVKIFQNGVFHITGVLDEKYDRDVIALLRETLRTSCPEAVEDKEWDLSSRRVVLMNYKTRLLDKTNLSRETLHAHVRRLGLKCNYEPAVYPAVKIYFPETKWIAKVFRTGNIILTGMTSASECDQLMEKLRPVLA
jgi:TATA-box binding protein (TBP) (component of TFIID and TFIIIB)